MIQYLKQNAIDRAKWDRCIEQSVNSMVYGYSWYLDFVAPKWEGLVLGDYEAVMPLTCNRKLFISYLYQPYFTQQLGVFYKTYETKLRLKDFIDAIPAKFKFIDINLNEDNDIPESAYPLKKRKNFVLDLERPYLTIYSEYDDHCQRNLKKAKKHIQSIKPIDIALGVAFYQKYIGDQTHQITVSDYENLLNVLVVAAEKGFVVAKGVYNEQKELVAIGIYVLHKGRMIYLLGGASEKGRELRAMFLLFDDLIRTFSEQKVVLDFEGSEIHGIARFFKGFGAVKNHYYKLHINRLPVPLRWLK